MARLGFEVNMTEALKYYSDLYNTFFDYVKSRNVSIVDFDPFMESYQGKTYDMVTIMAVIEHYPHSLSFLFENIKNMMHTDSILCLDVPNLAYIKTRISFLLGNSPLSPASLIYKSAVPYIGHHHEYTLNDIRELFALSPFVLTKLISHNYTPNRIINFINTITNPLILLNIFFEGTREVIYLEARKRK